jgi:Plant transposon protein
LQRIVAALRILSYGAAADATDEYIRISETSALVSLRRFCLAICDGFGREYGRQPTEEDMRRILAVNSMRGFSGCLGSIDCQHWNWERCPVAFAGQFMGKEKKPTVVLEAIADGELWIWHAYFGCPGNLNDLNVLNMSETMNSVLKGEYPPYFSFLSTVKSATLRTISQTAFTSPGLYLSRRLQILCRFSTSDSQQRRRQFAKTLKGLLVSLLHAFTYSNDFACCATARTWRTL